MPISLKLLLNGQLSHFQKQNFEVLAVSSGGPEVVDGTIDRVPHRVVNMTRKITPFRDLLALIQLMKVIIDFKPDIVHTHTPKAGLLGMVAAKLCGVPIRFHTVAGLPLIEKKGWLRKLLIIIERITYAAATNVYPNSRGLHDFIVEHIGSKTPLRIIGHGSSNGIDTRHFARNPDLQKQAIEIRSKHGIKPEDVVFSFVGRVVKDKGIGELVEAFRKCRKTFQHRPDVFLLIVGPFEQDLDPLSAEDYDFLNNDPAVILAGYQSDVRPWIIASDIFTFPSYREGFPNVVMQASCLEVPSIVSNINGCNEIVEHEKTGLIVSAKSSEELFQAMGLMVANPEMRLILARNARARVVQSFGREYIWAELEKEYRDAVRRSVDRRFSLYRDIIKPFFDRSIAFIAIVVFSPVLVVCIASLWKANNGKVWFRQYRPGRNGKLFQVLKFRTMTDERDSNGVLLPDEVRLHRVGKFIRKTSLDELPQLLNVLFGEMSIVGPRPLLEEYLPLYDEVQARRHNVTPGITGWAQVNGRNAISWEQKFAYDVWYVDHQSFLLDLKIIFLTVTKVFKAEGISSATSVTMEKFTGSRKTSPGISNTAKH